MGIFRDAECIYEYVRGKMNKIYQGDSLVVLKTLPNDSVDLVVTSPPYNCGIKYDGYDDKLPLKEYYDMLGGGMEGIIPCS